MEQPVVDTLQLSDALRETGLPREQAEGIARALGSELAGRVPVRSDLGVVRSDLETKIESVRADLDAKIESVRSDLDAKIESVRSDLDAKIECVRSDIKTLDSRFTAKFNMLGLGAGLMLAFLSVLVSLDLFRRPASTTLPPITVHIPPATLWTAPVAGTETVPAADGSLPSRKAEASTPTR